MMLIGLLVIGLIAYWAYDWYRPKNCRTYPVERTPLEIAQVRFARGEITSMEYEEIRKKLVEH